MSNADPFQPRADAAAAPYLLPLWRIALLLQSALTGVALWMLPHGFPWSHPRFAANVLFPLLLLCLCIAGLIAAWKRQYRLLSLLLFGLALLWTAALLSGLLVFPLSGRRIALPVGMGVATFAAGYWYCFRNLLPPWNAALLVALAMMVVGALIPITQRAPQPATRPLNVPLTAAPQDGATAPAAARLELDAQTAVHPGIHEVHWQGSLKVQVQPLLDFQSCSPDRCWTNLATRRSRLGPGRRLTAVTRIDSGYDLRYQGEAASLLQVLREPGGVLVIDAFTRLEKPVYSHLNSYAAILVDGHERLALAFSPCPETRIEVFAADYPVGRPMRLAYVDAERRFSVVEAASGEKGPFHPLAAGQLPPDAPLTMTCYDRGVARCRIELADWSAQLSTDLSPTAGWGLPQNAIEFRLLGNDPDAPAAIWLTLAGTSVGRGWDSVGHTRGIYRNRLRIESLDPSPHIADQDSLKQK